MLKKQDYLSFKTKEELFNKHEKDTFRIWLFGFLISTIVLLALAIASLIVVILSKDEIIESFLVNVKNQFPKEPFERQNQIAMSAYASGPLLLSILPAVGIIIAIVLLSWGLKQSYEKKSFHLLSPWPTTIVCAIVIINVIFLVTLISRPEQRIDLSSASTILNLVYSVLSILVWVIFGREASYIRRVFITYVRKEQQAKFFESFTKMQKDAASGNNDFLNIFGSFKQNENSNNSQTSTSTEENATVVEEKEKSEKTQSATNPKLAKHNFTKNEEEQFKKLLSLPNESLFNIANRLNIYGYEDMEKDDLIIQIIKVTRTTK
ncbi:hypothetical protein [Mycoplasmopsis alligatoris]|uniref:Rho termination factor N-terminal domain-containing protein n=1 Tax=Mycoplasmopsis alligatoris A21JP2 TaxID=747682 RepID=D4XWR6_9BACT|nr:hypothetical protein [Mycoplasmopsis alligatoris]EFF41349.1 hypothetical protein MALL_0362 [Mycoplasmopsis alligatoris A21JP2]